MRTQSITIKKKVGRRADFFFLSIQGLGVMRRLLFLFLLNRRDCTGWNLLGKGIDQKADASDDEGDGKNLTHVEGHAGLEVHLVLLDELNQEAHAKAAKQEDAKEEAAVGLVQTLPIPDDEEETQHEVTQCLVNLGGVLGLCLPVALEYEAPGQVGNATINLGVEEVAKADEAACEGYSDYQMVQNPDEIKAVLLAVFG